MFKIKFIFELSQRRFYPVVSKNDVNATLLDFAKKYDEKLRYCDILRVNCIDNKRSFSYVRVNEKIFTCK